jgi:hypothetical protein
MKKTNSVKCILAYTALAGFSVAIEASVVTVSPGNMNGWSFQTTTSYAGTPTAQMVTGPGTPPLGVGSAELTTPAAGGAALIYTSAYNGQSLSSITSLNYAAYDAVSGNGQQFPYMAIALGNGDVLFFEPPYQTPGTGNPSLPNQGPTQMNTWQTWNALTGGWWDNNGTFSPGTYESPTVPGVGSLATYAGTPSIGDLSIEGIYLQVGYDGTNNVGYVDDVTIGTTASGTTTYDFEPSSVPEPTTIVAGASLLLPFGASALRLLRKKQTA